jgi:hypothetical protein
MTSYEVNRAAVDHARSLIDAGTYDDTTGWSDAAPSTEDRNRELDEHGWEGYAQWHLGIDTDASEETKGRFHFPYGDFRAVNRSALIHAKQRATQNDHDALAKAADELLERLDRKRA